MLLRFSRSIVLAGGISSLTISPVGFASFDLGVIQLFCCTHVSEYFCYLFVLPTTFVSCDEFLIELFIFLNVRFLVGL